MGKYFGTDGFRGEAGITLTADHAYKVGRFLGWYYNMLRERNGDTNPARIVIGKDTRRSSYMFEYSLVAGLTASGADAYLLHVTTTPSVAYIARVDDFDCALENLSEDDLKLLTLYVYEGYNESEISKAFNVSQPSIHKRIMKIAIFLKKF